MKVESCLKYGVEYITQTDSYEKNLREKYGSETYNNPNKTKRARINNGTQFYCDFDILKVTVNKTYYTRNNKILINPYNLKEVLNLIISTMFP
jgi:hypothetical protein